MVECVQLSNELGEGMKNPLESLPMTIVLGLVILVILALIVQVAY